MGQGHTALVRTYEKNPAAIYAKSFETVRQEARLEGLPSDLHPVVIRLIHACGMVDLADDIVASEAAFAAGAEALARGTPILCDCQMVAAGVIRWQLPARNDVIVTLNDTEVATRARQMGTTRSAAAVTLWEPYLEGALVAIGNAPTALFQLLEMLENGAPRPALVLGFPVGFVGAAESKAELASLAHGCPFITLRGRRGGSAMAAAAVNALTNSLRTGEQ